MADYYSLLASKVATLEPSTPQTRKTVYDLARRALLNQLHAIKPPIADEVVAAEERALDEAVARVEAECEVKGLPDVETEKPAQQAPAPQPEPPVSPAPEATRDQKPEPLTPMRPRPAAPVAKAKAATRQKRWFMLMAAGSLLIVGLLAFLALRFRERPEDLAKFNPNENGAAADERGKIGDRVSDPDRRRTADQGPPIAVAQRAEFYVAYPNQPDKVEHIYSGSVLWRLENTGGADGGQLRPAIRGEVDFPDAKVKATILIQKNLDQALSASHTISIAFKFQGGDVKGISQIGNVELRRPDAQRGQPVAGIPVPINELNFLIGLMRGPPEARNLQLLRTPAIIDIPLKLSDDRLATMNLEKGASGERVFADALDAWSR